jgi:hypothetical protein
LPAAASPPTPRPANAPNAPLSADRSRGQGLVDARYGAIEVLGATGAKADLIATGVDERHLLEAFGIPERHGLLETPAGVPAVPADGME